MSDQLNSGAAWSPAPAGWYADPAHPGHERWWDGSVWTSANRPTWMPAPAQQTPSAAARPKETLWRTQKVLLVVAALALIVVAVGGFTLARAVLPAFTTAPVSTPGTIVDELEPGRYTVFERTGTTNQTGPVTISNGRAPLIGAGDISVTGPDGVVVPVAERSISETINRGNAMYSSVAGFEVDRAGTYETRIDGPATEVIQTRALFDGTSSAFVVFGIGAVVGGISATTFVVIVLVKASRRRRGVS